MSDQIPPNSPEIPRTAPHLTYVPLDQAHPAYKEVVRSASDALGELLIDPLTGLKNERAFIMILGAMIEQQNQRPEAVPGEESDMVLLSIDVDGFKGVNDTLGHDVGDEVLKTIGSALPERGLRKSDKPLMFSVHTEDDVDEPETAAVIVRTHGDELEVIIPNIRARVENPDLTMEERNAGVKRHLRQSVAEAIESSPYRDDLKRLGVGISIGAVVYKYGESINDLLKRGDENMYEDKRERKRLARQTQAQQPLGRTSFTNWIKDQRS